MSDPLDDEFDIDISAEDLASQISIPEDSELHDLNLTIKRALIDYQNIMNDAHRYEAKLKIEAYKLGRDFLREARTAIVKRDELILKEKYGITAGIPHRKEGDGEKEDTGSIRKEDAFDELERRKQELKR